MPSVSKAQHNLMAAAANDGRFAKEHNISQKVARDYMEADKGKRFGKKGAKLSDETRKKARYK